MSSFEPENEISVLVAALIEKVKQPAEDIEKNIKAFLAEAISKMDLVTKEELDRQVILLNKANQKLAELEKKLDTLTDEVN